MNRITINDLKRLCDQLNKVTNSPMQPYSKAPDGHSVGNIGNYHINSAYGGYCLHRMVNEGGGVTTPLYSGHVPARELYGQMQAFLRGFELAKEQATDSGERTTQSGKYTVGVHRDKYRGWFEHNTRGEDAAGGCGSRTAS